MFTKLTDQATIPVKAHAYDAGWDLCASEDALILAGGVCTVGTGVSVQLPQASVGLVCPRSGLAARHAVTVANAPGVVDAGYTGELKVILRNDGVKPYFVHAGDRIAQLVVLPALIDGAGSARGAAGFGSTGV